MVWLLASLMSPLNNLNVQKGKEEGEKIIKVSGCAWEKGVKYFYAKWLKKKILLCRPGMPSLKSLKKSSPNK